MQALDEVNKLTCNAVAMLAAKAAVEVCCQLASDFWAFEARHSQQ